MAELKKVNYKLPSLVYVPFVKDGLRNYCVLNIVVEQTKIFSTKERYPYCITLELYRPEEDIVIPKKM